MKKNTKEESKIEIQFALIVTSDKTVLYVNHYCTLYRSVFTNNINQIKIKASLFSDYKDP